MDKRTNENAGFPEIKPGPEPLLTAWEVMHEIRKRTGADNVAFYQAGSERDMLRVALRYKDGRTLSRLYTSEQLYAVDDRVFLDRLEHDAREFRGDGISGGG